MTDKPLLQAFRSPDPARPPVWLMRQAGRYLPEYRALRADVRDFLTFCYTPALTVEAALQPLRRFGLDAAILFSDILVVPDGLGRSVRFVEGTGPVLDPVRRAEDVPAFSVDAFEARLAPVFQSVRMLKASLAPEVTLIGFAGAPWTVALYMVQGRGGGESETVRAMAYAAPAMFGDLIRVLVDATTHHLIRQIDSGADVVQLFDTWAGVLAEEQFRRWVIAPTAEIVGRVRAAHPEVPIIGFPRGAGALYAEYVDATGVDGVGLDAGVPLDWARETLQGRALVQGNLDNLLLVTGGQAMHEAIERIVRKLSSGRFVFNLGHGVLPQTPPEHVGDLMERLRATSKAVPQ